MTLCVTRRTQSVPGGITTQSVGTIEIDRNEFLFHILKYANFYSINTPLENNNSKEHRYA
ncbi:hypothetical protein K0P33_18060 [Pseudomonas sp. ArH3a]|uniref:hypothetical protein n=1 Tax=Pseudomonas sp. ArH3a TaxID=2862945 RepID=UPI001F5785F4|nr:hypothetical protein [Pseudomonas sp. ArH3a]UNM17471.1 hypothetical protein K0P33_18060 [Pseudomonas sp. ArH3a]